MRMTSWLGLVVGITAARGGATPATDPARIDAFLASARRVALVDSSELSLLARAQLARSTIAATEPRLGVPTVLWSQRRPVGTRSPRELGMTAEQAARRALVAHAELYRGSASVWASAELERLHDLDDGGAVVASFQQHVGGVRLFRDEVKVVLTKDYELVALMGYLTPRRRVLGEFAISMEAAIDSAVNDLEARSTQARDLRKIGTQSGGYRLFQLGEEPTPVRVRPVYFPLPSGVAPAYYLEVELSRGTDGEYFAYAVSAQDGRVLFRNNLRADAAFSYRVWADTSADHTPLDGPGGNGSTPHPTGQRGAWAPAWVPSALVTLEHLPRFSRLDPWLSEAAAYTNGNNVHAYADIVKPNGYNPGDPIPRVTAAAQFDYAYDLLLDPEANTTQRLASVTQLFYTVNYLHDWFYDRGLDEASGNAQAGNFGRGGIQGDAIKAEAQDASGRSNANMSTPADGASPRMQMYVFDSAGQIKVEVRTPRPLQLSAGGAEFGAQAFSTSGDLALAEDGSTASGGSSTDACQPLPSPATGKIVLIDRGLCSFVAKARNAAAAGAVGVIIANNAATPAVMSMAGTDDGLVIPAVGVSQADGVVLKGLLASGPVSLALLKEGAINRDGALDSTIVAHEWGHYLSNRSVGDGNGLSTPQAAGMGEGWSDFTALLMVVRTEDAQVPGNAGFAGVYGLAGYAAAALSAEGHYFGIRRVPYSTDLARNGLTFKHIQDGVALPTSVPTAFGEAGTENSEVHNTGEVWATVLWECYAALLRDSRYSFDEARDRMARYLVASLKATPVSPTMLEARDALLAVAAARDLEDYALFWRAFAKRGMGMGAVGPSRDSTTNTPVSESFEVGSAAQIVSVGLSDSARSCDGDGNLDNDEEGLLSVVVQNVGIGVLAGGSVEVASTSGGLAFPAGVAQAMSALAPFQAAELRFPVRAVGLRAMAGEVVRVVARAPGLVGGGSVERDGKFRVNFDVVPSASIRDDVESPTSAWTTAEEPSLATGSSWSVFTAGPAARHWLGPGPGFPADLWLISPKLTVASNTDFVVTFSHRFDFEKSTKAFDGAVLELSVDDGQTWRDVGGSAAPGYNGTLDDEGRNPLGGRRAYTGKSRGYPAFTPVTVNLGRTFAGQRVLLRFRVGADDSMGARGWEVDDLQFAGIVGRPFSAIVSDENACGTNRAPRLVVGPDQVALTGDVVTLAGSATDPEGDAVSLTWVQRQGPSVMLSGGTFVAPKVLGDTLLVFELTASDGLHEAGPLPVLVNVQYVNRRPVAKVLERLEVASGAAVSFVGTASDEDGDALRYAWAQVAGPLVDLAASDQPSVDFVAPEVGEQTVLTFELAVRDAALESLPARVDVVVTPRQATSGSPRRGCGCGAGAGLEAFPLIGLLAALRAKARARRAGTRDAEGYPSLWS
jgi:hypothetical protein